MTAAMYCLRCRGPLQPEDRRCESCGARTRPHPARRIAAVAVAAALVSALLIATEHLWAVAHEQGRIEAAHDARPAAPARGGPTTSVVPAAALATPSAPGTTVPVPQSVKVVKAVATATSPPSVNGCNKPVTYDASLVVDLDPTTAWRVPGDGIGQRVQLTLDRPTRLLQVGLLPGYARVDPCTKVDRFPQMRRVTEVRWLFDGGAAVRQRLADDPVTQSIPVDVVTRTVTVEITGTTDAPELDFTPISEVRLGGVPAATG